MLTRESLVPNPRPRTDQLTPFEPQGKFALSSKVYGARMPRQLAEVLEKVDNLPDWLRSAVEEKAEREGLI
jgi:hypothetical protein